MKTCQHCETRHEGCHAHCDIYAYEKRQHDRQKNNKNRMAQNDYNGYVKTWNGVRHLIINRYSDIRGNML